MAGNVALDSGQLDSPLSVLSSPSQTSEASSVGTGRVFFGPVRSPEKRFARRAGSAPFRTPVRRSTRLSSAMVPPPVFPQHQAAAAAVQAAASGSQEEALDEDGLPDEPSVILASRVLSASGNPSPPPSPPLTSQPEDAYMDVQLLDIAHSPRSSSTPTAAPQGPLIPVEETWELVPASSPLASRASTPTHAIRDVANTSQPDLITFDSFSAPDDDEPSASVESQERLEVPPEQPITSVDDLLSISPRPPPATSSRVQPRGPPNSSEEDPSDSATNPDEEMEVVNSLIIEVDPPAPSSPGRENMQPRQEEGLQAPLAEPVQDSSPPIRRSTRPRKSRSSLPQTVATSPQPPVPTENATNRQGTEAQAQQEFQPSPVRKRKLKVVPPLDDKGAGSSTDVTTPRKMPQVDLLRRDLGSLSPLSAAVLTQLLPKAADESASRSTTPQPPENSQAAPSEPAFAPAPSTPPNQTTKLIFPKVGPQADGEVAEIQRPRSPLRPFPASPFKLDDTLRTPARRVPLAQAIAEGTYSTHKIPALFSASRPTNAPSSPVFKRQALDDPTRSPAKRIPMSEALLVPPPSPDKGKAVARPTSPIRPQARERQRSGSAEPRPLLGRKERGSSAEPTTRVPALGRRPVFQKPASSEGLASSSALVKPRTVLPFPLAQSQRLHPAIPESDEPGPSTMRPHATTAGAGPGAQAKVSPAKAGSSLRQPSASAGSKIPRIGAKPYARPKAVGKPETAQSKLPTPAKSRVAAKPLRIVTVGSSSSGGSSDEGHGANASAPKPARRLVPAAPTSEASSAHGLKRKREADASKPAVPAAQPVILIRKVVPGMFNKGDKAGPAAGSSSAATTAEQPQSKSQVSVASPAKAAGPIKGRSAANWKRPQPESVPAPPPPSPAHPAQATPQRATLEPTPARLPTAFERKLEIVDVSPAKEVREPTPPPPAVSSAAPAPAVPVSVAPPPQASAPPAGSTEAASEGSASGTSAPPTAAEEQPGRQHRRSTRSRRSQEDASGTDVFGTVPPAPSGSTRPLQVRRKPRPLPSDTTGPFAGMSALALKTLTNANTLKNQQQVAVLKTEVVRKEGARPDSPTTKVRTALERQREERAMQRKERAERRARRSGGGEVDEGTVVAAGPGDMESEIGDASFVSVDRDDDGAPLRHRRGPGDEEDYVTPPRPERPVKRARFEGGDEKEKETQEKRVKWDKGLHTTVYLDDSPPKPKRNKQAVPSQKSCLTPAAKALRLDTLGNVLNAELPVGGLVRENIVVKKFIFEDDVEPEVASPAPVKSTRSKSKKTKS
ncbi:hypothetical protein BV20DRAFT_1118056 [Pilatotrama ljubarskyi]|nr:hypothetical protein BV20DRAFT_1118056 [Pilatotrama ljubarskyi]